jgi:hypothetical protein
MLLFHSLLLHVSWGPQYGSPPFKFPSRSLCKERDAPLPKPSLTCVSESPVKKPPSRFPLRSPYIENDVPFPQPSFMYLSKSPVNDPLPPPPTFRSQSPMQRDASFPEFSFTCLTKSPVKKTPPRSPNGAPMERDARHQSLLLHIFQSPPSRSPPPQVPLSEPPAKRRSVFRAFFSLSLEVPDKGVLPPSSPSGAHMERDTRRTAFFYISLGDLMKKFS